MRDARAWRTQLVSASCTDAVDARAVLLGQEIEVAVDGELHRHAEAAAEVAHVPLERGLQAEVVEHARPQAEREIAHRADHVVDELPALGDRAGDARVARGRAARSMRPSSMRSAVSIWPT